MNPEDSLTPEEIAIFQAMVKPGIVYLLMMRLDRPIGAREISDLLGIHEQTAARYLRALSRLNLVVRVSARQGYVLLNGSQLVLGELPESLALPEPDEESEPEDPGQFEDTTKISQYPSTTIKLINNHLNDSEVVVVDRPTSKISCYQTPQAEGQALLQGRGSAPTDFVRGPDRFLQLSPSPNPNITQDEGNDKHAEIWRELAAAGIGPNNRTRELVRLPHITPDYVKAHRLQLESKGKDFPRWAGLLVTVLERGDSASELNPNGHLGSCKCAECHHYKIAKSWADPY